MGYQGRLIAFIAGSLVALWTQAADIREINPQAGLNEIPVGTTIHFVLPNLDQINPLKPSQGNIFQKILYFKNGVMSFRAPGEGKGPYCAFQLSRFDSDEATENEMNFQVVDSNTEVVRNPIFALMANSIQLFDAESGNDETVFANPDFECETGSTSIFTRGLRVRDFTDAMGSYLK